MKKIALLLAVLLTLSGCNIKEEREKKAQYINTEDTTDSMEAVPAAAVSENIQSIENQPSEGETVGDQSPVSRAMAAKMLSLINKDIKDISHTDRVITFTDTDTSKWYDKFINTAYIDGLMNGYGELFKPEEALTLEHAQLLLNNISEKHSPKLQITDENKDKPISYALWIEMYIKFIENISSDISEFGIEEKEITVLASPGNNGLLTGYNLISDTGPYTFTGLFMDTYIDKKIKVLVKGKEILGVISVTDMQPLIRNCYIAGITEKNITIFTGGAERTYNLNEKVSANEGDICDIRIDGEEAVELVIHGNKLEDTVLRFDNDIFEFEENGILSASEDFKVYSVVSGRVKWQTAGNLFAGTKMAYFTLNNDTVCGGVITQNAVISDIRVAISNTGFSSLYHSDISLTSAGSYHVTAGDSVKKYEGGEVFSVSALNGTDWERLYIEPENAGDKIQLLSVKRNWPEGESPSYRGRFEIGRDSKGYTLINVVDFEEYLYSVVPSEMPSGYGTEASMVQAVAARSYAYNQFYENRFYKYGANIDDSVSCQVYNNIPENEISITAVDNTKGMCLSYNSAVVTANFFSTSAGATANSGEVWGNSGERQFPGNTLEYLRAQSQYQGMDFGDLSIEENAERFLKTIEIDCFDNHNSWFRWNTVLTAKDLTNSVNSALAGRYGANPWLIRTLDEDGSYRVKDISTIGTVTDISIVRRGEGGNIMEMKITGTEAVILVSTEYNIRALLKPSVINRWDGTTADSSILPSAFFTMDKTYNDNGTISEVKIYGGGNGHGVGMSQNGVRGMVEQGYSVQDILTHYFPGCETVKIF